MAAKQQQQPQTRFESVPLDQDEEEAPKSSLSNTVANVLNLINDGLYRMKNRNKSE